MVGTMAASGAAIAKAGTNVAIVAPASLWDDWIEEAESYIVNLLKFDAVSGWTTLDLIKRKMLSEYVARSAANEGIK